MKLSQRLQDERVFVERSLGDSVICTACKATLKTFADACTAGLSEQCEGYLAIEFAKSHFAELPACKSMPPVGDKGQRYEVRFRNEKGEERIFGWCNDPTGGGLFDSAVLMPSARDPFVIDRQTGEIVREEKG